MVIMLGDSVPNEGSDRVQLHLLGNSVPSQGSDRTAMLVRRQCVL